jgi:hypothetical protein
MNRLTVIVWIACILSISLASTKGFTLEQEELRGGIFSPDGNLLVVRTETGVLVFDTGNLLRIQKLSTQGLGVGELASVLTVVIFPGVRNPLLEEVWEFGTSSLLPRLPTFS